MKKFLLAAILFVTAIFFGTAQSTQAATVSLCDFSLSQFVERYNAVVQAGKFPQTMMIRNLDDRHSLNYKNYTDYSTFLGDKGHGVILIIFTDQQGCVAELGWLFGSEDHASQLGSTMVLLCSLFAAGLNDNEFETFKSSLPPNSRPTMNMNVSVWCSGTGRQICFTNTYAPNGRQGFTQINLYAER